MLRDMLIGLLLAAMTMGTTRARADEETGGDALKVV